jgi:hypothetical protein
MNLLWDLYWPVLTVAVVLGVNFGAFAFRKRGPSQFKKINWPVRRKLALAGGIALVLAFGAIWHGPVGKGEQFVAETERFTRSVLVDWEMAPVTAVVASNPIRRALILSGPADDFQRSELVRILNGVPGIANVWWVDQAPIFTLPLLLEVELAALVSFGVGLVLAYLLELRRRSNAQWRW